MNMARKKKADFGVDNHGSLCILHLYSQAAKDWGAEHIGDEETMTWCGGIVVEPRYIGAIMDGLIEEGFTYD
jgi:hypothetical protein